MDMRRGREKIAGMARKRVLTLYIGQWMSRLGRKPSEVAKATKINEGYLSQLISGEKNNPSGRTLYMISTELGVSINALYEKPPEMDVTGRVQHLSPQQLEALASLLAGYKPPDRH